MFNNTQEGAKPPAATPGVLFFNAICNMITDLQISAPGLLFSTVSLFLMAYTNRFLTLTKLIRDLYEKYQATRDISVLKQLHLFHKHLRIIKCVQFICVISFGFAIISMLLILGDAKLIAAWMFSISLAFLMTSLILCIYEIYISTNALSVSVSDLKYTEKVP